MAPARKGLKREQTLGLITPDESMYSYRTITPKREIVEIDLTSLSDHSEDPFQVGSGHTEPSDDYSNASRAAEQQRRSASGNECLVDFAIFKF